MQEFIARWRPIPGTNPSLVAIKTNFSCGATKCPLVPIASAHYETYMATDYFDHVYMYIGGSGYWMRLSHGAWNCERPDDVDG